MSSCYQIISLKDKKVVVYLMIKNMKLCPVYYASVSSIHGTLLSNACHLAVTYIYYILYIYIINIL